MFPLRHAARLLTTRSISIAARPRTITSFASLPSRPAKFAAPIQFQRRWATGEAEAKKEDEAPVSQLQATPEEEVENTIQEDNAAAGVRSAGEEAQTGSATETPIADTANATEATDDATTTAAESESTQEAVDSIPSARGTADAMFDSARGNAPTPTRRPFREPATPKPTIYIGNLFFDVTENDLQKEFERFGPIKKTRLVRDTRGLSKGFGYISFDTTEQAQQAVDELNQQLFEGRRLLVSFAHTDDATFSSNRETREHKPQNAPSKTLFIGNMSFEMTDRDLNNLFRGIRNVIDVRVAIDRRTGQPRGFAHADFVDVKSAMEALKVLTGKENYGRKLRVDYSFGPSTAPRNTPR